MKPEEKAKELIMQFVILFHDIANPFELAKECALIAVKELRKECVWIREKYYDEVETEIKK